jgi:hypothetical protein
MKYLVAAIIGLLALTVQAEAKKVCVKQTDAKTKKEKEVCKTIKVHKKLDGTKIEDAKKEDTKKKK